MSKKILFILGKTLKEYTSSIDFNKYDVFLLKDSTLKKISSTNYKDIFEIDFKNKHNFLESLKKIKIIPDGILCLYENYVVAKAWAGEYYKLNILSEEAAIAATDKIVMRQRFFEFDSSITPNFQEVKSESDIVDFTEKFKFPVILKPANLSKSLLIQKCTTLSDALSYFKEMKHLLPSTYNKFNIHNDSGRIIIEEYLEGSMHTVAAFSDKNGKIHLCHDIVDNITARDIGKDDNYLYIRSIPSSLTKIQKDIVLDIAEKGMKALNLRGSAGHVEVFYTKKGPKLIEIGARLGGYRSRMYRLASGINLIEADINANIGKKINLKKIKNDFSSVFEIFPEEEGLFDKVNNIEQLNSLRSFVSYNMNVTNEKVGPANKGYKFVMNIILSNNDKSIVNKDIDYIKKNISIKLK